MSSECNRQVDRRGMVAVPAILVILIGLVGLVFSSSGKAAAVSAGEQKPMAGPGGCAPSGVVVPSPNASNGFDHLQGTAAVAANDIWAVGYAAGTGLVTEHWNGTQWSVITLTITGELNAVAAV